MFSLSENNRLFTQALKYRSRSLKYKSRLLKLNLAAWPARFQHEIQTQFLPNKLYSFPLQAAKTKPLNAASFPYLFISFVHSRCI